MLAVSMSGVKLGDRVVFVGVPDADLVAAIAGKVGLSGRAVAVTADDREQSRVQKAAANAGVLVDTEATDLTRLSFADGEFDIAVVDDTGGLLEAASERDRSAIGREVARVLRPGGRLLLIGGGEPTGIARLVSKAAASPLVVSGAASSLLGVCGFSLIRTLGEREGLVFIEGLKPRTSVPAQAHR